MRFNHIFVPYLGKDLSSEILMLDGIGAVIVQVNSPKVAELIGQISIFRYGWGNGYIDYYSLTKEQRKIVKNHVKKITEK